MFEDLEAFRAGERGVKELSEGMKTVGRSNGDVIGAE